MSEKGRSSGRTVARSQPAAAASATIPGRVARRMRSTPSETRGRFSPASGIMSERVPSAATSTYERQSSGRPRRRPSSQTSLRATPAPASSREGQSAESLGSVTGTPAGTWSAGS